MQPYADELRDIHYKQKPVQHNTIILHHREFGHTIRSYNQIRRDLYLNSPYIQAPIQSARKLARRLRTIIKSA